MIKISYPVIFNTNFQVQDRKGVVICNLFGTHPEPEDVREMGIWLCGLINASDVPKASPVEVKPLDAPLESVLDKSIQVKVDGEVNEVKPFEGIPCNDPASVEVVNPVKRKGNPAFQKGQKNPYAKKK